MLYGTGQLIESLELPKAHTANGHLALLFQRLTPALDIPAGFFELERTTFTDNALYI